MNVSVIIPCYNAEPYLAQTIGSALEQTRPAHEIIVVDDGSTDDSLAIARRFEAGAEGRLRVFSERSGRASRTRNLGALSSSGEALMFLDADDVLGPDTLDELVNALEQQPDGVAVCPWHRLEEEDGRWVRRPPSCLPRKPGHDALDAWLRGWYHPPCSVFWSREAFERAGRWDELTTVNDDGDLMMRALVQGAPLLEASAGAGFYRRLSGGEVSLSSTQFTADGIAARLRVIKKIARWLEEYGRAWEYRSALYQAIWLIAADAEGRHPELFEQAQAIASRYAPPLWVRAGRRGLRVLRVAPTGPPYPEAPAGEPAEEIQFGQETAQQILRSQAAIGVDTPLHPERPAVSVVIPTYNRARLLRRAIQSVLAQTFTDFEILIVDDGSTDDTPAVVEGFDDARIRYLPQPENAGVSAARNRGLREARGAFIAFLDSDDTWYPHKLALQVPQMRDLPDDVGLLYCGVENDDGRGNCSLVTPTHRGDLYRQLLLSNVLHGTSGVMIRRAVVATAGFFDEGIPAIEDYDYWLRVARFFKFDFIAEPLIRYHDPQWMERKSLNFGENMDARAWLFRKHATEMRRAGVADVFLLESARRHLLPPRTDIRAARRLAAQAVWHAPRSRTAWGALRRLMLSRDGGGLWRDSSPEPPQSPQSPQPEAESTVNAPEAV